MERWSRLAPLTGIVFVALLIVSFAIGGSTPGTHASSAKVISFYEKHHNAQMLSAFLGALGTAFFLFFAATLRSYFRRTEQARDVAPLILAGAVVLATGGTVFSSLTFALADARHKVDPSAAQALNVLSNDFFWPLVIGTAVFMIANAVAVLRSRALPVWLGWIAIPIAVISVTPIGFIGFLATMAWTLIVSVLLYLRDAPVAPATAPV
jgi:hypothetical protein